MNLLMKLGSMLMLSLLVITCVKNDRTPVTEVELDEVALCVGDYYTEEEAVEKLNQFSQNFSNADEWVARSGRIREQIYQGAGLDEIPLAYWETSIKITRGQKHDMDGYSVENIALEMHPGYVVHGNLYQPLTIQNRIPAVLSPHGHWFKPDDYGRLRPDMQLRCASLAKMGAIVFAYDMYGTGEDDAHDHRSDDALTWQCYNSIRILDFISALDYVDTTRIAVTGASGGGTQTFLLAALDDRVAVSVPTVMVSAHFFGGCVCESGKPIHKSGEFETNNVEIAASIAPKPLMIIGDGDDWTRNIQEVEFPYIKRIYDMFDASTNTEYAFFEDEVHDYGFSKRTAAYGFLAKHLDLDLGEIQDNQGNIDEGFVTLLDTTQLKVYPGRELVKVP